MTTSTGTGIKGNVAALKKAVSAVVKTNKSWLQVLETYLEGLKQSDQSIVKGIIESLLGKYSDISQLVSDTDPDQFMRETLDELARLQLADKRLGGKVPQTSATSEGLSIAIKEAEAYLITTQEAFTLLQCFSTGIDNEDVKSEGAAYPAQQARNGLRQQVDELPQGEKVALSPVEPEETDLRLGNISDDMKDFLKRLKDVGGDCKTTEQLFKNQRLTLSDHQIIKLTQSWGQMISDLIKLDEAKEKELPDQEVELIIVHDLLEILYERLEINVQRKTESILVDLESPNI